VASGSPSGKQCYITQTDEQTLICGLGLVVVLAVWPRSCDGPVLRSSFPRQAFRPGNSYKRQSTFGAELGTLHLVQRDWPGLVRCRLRGLAGLRAVCRQAVQVWGRCRGGWPESMPSDHAAREAPSSPLFPQYPCTHPHVTEPQHPITPQSASPPSPSPTPQNLTALHRLTRHQPSSPARWCGAGWGEVVGWVLVG